MDSAHQLVFGSFRLDPHAQQLWRGEEALGLQARPLAVLQYLVARPGQVVTKEELLSAIWGATSVSKAVLKVAIRAIREALGEQANAPQYIETVGRTGYRYIGGGAAHPTAPSAPEVETAKGACLVGREPELAQLQDALAHALQGERQLVFVTGEPGIGKSTLVDLFQRHLQSLQQTAVGYGQCVEQYGEGEPYLPILEALSRLCRQADGKHLGSLLRQYAPTWAVSMPGVLDETEQEMLFTQAQGATRERRLRELVDAIEISCTQRPLVLVFEDLHWSDYSTLELLSYLAQRRERARLMLIGTYRPEEVLLREHPLQGMRQELQARQCCREVAVELFTRPQVEAYLSERFANSPFVGELAAAVHARTSGHALFMVNLVDALVAQEVIRREGDQWQLTSNVEQVGIPENVQQLIHRQVERLPEEEQRLLEGASVAGTEFEVATVAAALQRELDSVEDACEQLAWQGLFLEESGVAEWADGTVSGQYRFRHILYQQVIYGRISAARQVRLHRLIQ
ncbi:MAG: transcriptional regulator [Candidatus Entotheonella factor]|uniref:Transcriptional regulator n=1 Tax=Entotheonella factor TaxID=1429438 RepID=W4LJB3_ENTF1|nr:MAG: transcriptional regulator [Candidatus Entotheonella factor]